MIRDWLTRDSFYKNTNFYESQGNDFFEKNKITKL